MNIAFPYISGDGWTGGLHYLNNLLEALCHLPEDQKPDIHLLVPKSKIGSSENEKKCVRSFLEYPASGVREKLNKLAGRINHPVAKHFEVEPSISLFLKNNKIDICFATRSEFGACFKVPLVTWIPDLQPLMLPEMYSAEENKRICRRFYRIVKHAKKIVLSSQASYGDFKVHFSQYKGKTSVLNFVASLPEEVYHGDPGWVCKEYDLPERFFYLPNQFWKHKNHLTVIEALKMLRSKNMRITIVCTGNTNDQRNPLYMGKLLSKISESGLRNQFIVLGLIPHHHIFALMRQSISVLQPSLFEGWSTTVEEAKSLGKKVILSDIRVHREQRAHGALYFDPSNPDALASCLLKMHEENVAGPDWSYEKEAQQKLSVRKKIFAEQFMEIMESLA